VPAESPAGAAVPPGSGQKEGLKPGLKGWYSFELTFLQTCLKYLFFERDI
jgi:hypothetical protein